MGGSSAPLSLLLLLFFTLVAALLPVLCYTQAAPQPAYMEDSPSRVNARRGMGEMDRVAPITLGQSTMLCGDLWEDGQSRPRKIVLRLDYREPRARISFYYGNGWKSSVAIFNYHERVKYHIHSDLESGLITCTPQPITFSLPPVDSLSYGFEFVSSIAQLSIPLNVAGTWHHYYGGQRFARAWSELLGSERSPDALDLYRPVARQRAYAEYDWILAARGGGFVLAIPGSGVHQERHLPQLFDPSFYCTEQHTRRWLPVEVEDDQWVLMDRNEPEPVVEEGSPPLRAGPTTPHQHLHEVESYKLLLEEFFVLLVGGAVVIAAYVILRRRGVTFSLTKKRKDSMEPSK